MKILFVCSGNTCRSAMAEGIAKKLLAKRNMEWEIASAGTLGLEGHSASINAVLVCEKSGVDISDHSSRGLTADLLSKFDYIFGMENAHVQYVKWLAPEVRGRTFLLGGYGKRTEGKEIPDPVGRDIDFFREIRDEIRTEIDRIFSEIENEN